MKSVAGRLPRTSTARPSMVGVAVRAWGAASFENESALEWFSEVEEAVDPGELSWRPWRSGGGDPATLAP
jgi:hypothetical protein